ncbi:MAG TPA: alpha/beta fold hydrolase [Firmicutes bacterium]|nr:alpha/beta fold hydrolase [Bacillota bacterium]
MKKRLGLIFSIVVAVLVLLFIGLSAFIGLQVFAGSTQLVTNEKTRAVPAGFWEKYGLDYESFRRQYQVEEIEIPSSFGGHKIPADYIYAVESGNSKNHPTVIMIHGLGGNRYTNYPITQYFLGKGYNVITYDQRSSNQNTARYTTFGYWEKYDLIDWVNYIEEQAPGQKIGVWGTSYGGATAGLAVGYGDMDKRIDFLILDSPVSSMAWMIEEEMKGMNIGIPVGYMSWCGNIVNKLKLGFAYRDAEVAAVMQDVKTPVLVINSKADALTPYFMGKDIYNAVSENKGEIWTVDDSKHFEIWVDYNQEYRKRMDDFLTKYE